MKSNIKIIETLILFFIVLNFINCKSGNITKPSTHFSFTVSGMIFEMFNGDSIAVSNAIVSIGTASDTTDNAGVFSIAGIEKGDYKISTRHMFENQIRISEVMFTISGDTTLFLELESIKLDFFPIMVSNTWVYDYYHARTLSPNEHYLKINGSRIFKVLEYIPGQNVASYRIQDVFTGTCILHHLENDKRDTTLVEDATTSFILTLDEDNIITITYHEPFSDSIIGSGIEYDDIFRLWNPLQFSRYHPSSATTAIEYSGNCGNGVCRLTLERDVGINKYEYSVIANHGVYSKLTLREMIK